MSKTSPIKRCMKFRSFLSKNSNNGAALIEYVASKIITAIYFHILSVLYFEKYFGKKINSKKRNTHISQKVQEE